MVKSDLAEKLSERADITQAVAEEIIDLFFDTIKESLIEGERVEIRGFGAFTVKHYKGYLGRNPKTGARIKVAAKRLPCWKAGLELRQRVSGAGSSSSLKD